MRPAARWRMPGRRPSKTFNLSENESPTAPNILIGTPPTIVRSSPWPILCQFLAFLPGWSGQAGAASVGARRCDSQIVSNSGGSAFQEWLSETVPDSMSAGCRSRQCHARDKASRSEAIVVVARRRVELLVKADFCVPIIRAGVRRLEIVGLTKGGRAWMAGRCRAAERPRGSPDMPCSGRRKEYRLEVGMVLADAAKPR